MSTNPKEALELRLSLQGLVEKLEAMARNADSDSIDPTIPMRSQVFKGGRAAGLRLAARTVADELASLLPTLQIEQEHEEHMARVDRERRAAGRTGSIAATNEKAASVDDLRWLDEIEAQLDSTVPYYVPRLVAEVRHLERVLALMRREPHAR